MRRTDREVRDFAEIFGILNRCDTVRIAMRGDAYPYVVPVSFGAEAVDGKAVLYFHCAREGRKIELLKKDPRVCVEGDVFFRTEPTDHGITTRYESVIGFGTCRFLEDEAEIVHALRILTEHYGYVGYDLANCRALRFVRVGKIVLNEISGKRNAAPIGGSET